MFRGRYASGRAMKRREHMEEGLTASIVCWCLYRTKRRTAKAQGGGETPEKPESREGTPENPDSGGGTPETPEGDGQTPSPPKMVEKILVHAGTALYLDSQKIYEGMADERSCGRQFYGKLFIFDGKKALCYGEFEKEKTEETPEKTAADGDAEKEEKPEKEFMVKTLEDAAYIPTIIVSRNPSGGAGTAKPSGTEMERKFFEQRECDSLSAYDKGPGR